MVAERKELERNTLVQQLGRAYDGIRQGPSRGTVIFFALVAATVLVYLVFHYFSSQSSKASSERWYELDSVVFPSQVDSLVKDSKIEGTPQYRLARFKEARVKLAQGLRDLGDPFKRKQAHQQIDQGVEIYNELAQTAGRVPLLHQEALWGAAKGYETLGGPENIEKASGLYTKLQAEYPSSALGKDARKQLDRLGSDATRQNLREINKELAVSASGKD